MSSMWLFLVVYVVMHTALYAQVLKKDRSAITQMGLMMLGLVPVFGVYVLGEQALYEAGKIKRPPALPPPEPESRVVRKVSPDQEPK